LYKKKILGSKSSAEKEEKGEKAQWFNLKYQSSNQKKQEGDSVLLPKRQKSRNMGCAASTDAPKARKDVTGVETKRYVSKKLPKAPTCALGARRPKTPSESATSRGSLRSVESYFRKTAAARDDADDDDAPADGTDCCGRETNLQIGASEGCTAKDVAADALKMGRVASGLGSGTATPVSASMLPPGALRRVQRWVDGAATPYDEDDDVLPVPGSIGHAIPAPLTEAALARHEDLVWRPSYA